MKVILVLFLIGIPTLEYGMRGNVRPLIAAARNREACHPHPPVRKIIIARFINGQWYEKTYTKELKDHNREPFLKHPEVEAQIRVKRSKPWRRYSNDR